MSTNSGTTFFTYFNFDSKYFTNEEIIFRPLDKGLTIDKIKEIRAKLISNRRTRIKPEDEDAGGKAEGLASAIGDLEVKTEKML